MKISIDKLKELSKSLLFEMEEKEYTTLVEEFDIITRQMELLAPINCDDVLPMTFPSDQINTYLRLDEPKNFIDVHEALLNAPQSVDNQVKINWRKTNGK